MLQLGNPAGPMPPLRWRNLADLCALTAVDGHALPVDLLEATLGAGLLAQLVRDTSGRQSGENSLAMLAPALTDPVPTEWRPCRFAGSRFEDTRPMNVSGLKQLAPDFDGMLGRIAALRAAFLARIGRDRLDLGGMWLLSWVFFVLPAWTARRVADRCPNGAVPEWATALSKTFGGVRMTLQMLLARGCRVDTEFSPAELVRVTEEEARYLSVTGVSAGTPAMIDRTLDVFVSGTCAPAAPPIPELARALDYGFATAALLLVAAAREARTRFWSPRPASARSRLRTSSRISITARAMPNSPCGATELAAIVHVAVDPGRRRSVPPCLCRTPAPISAGGAWHRTRSRAPCRASPGDRERRARIAGVATSGASRCGPRSDAHAGACGATVLRPTSAGSSTRMSVASTCLSPVAASDRPGRMSR